MSFVIVVNQIKLKCKCLKNVMFKQKLKHGMKISAKNPTSIVLFLFLVKIKQKYVANVNRHCLHFLELYFWRGLANLPFS